MICRVKWSQRNLQRGEILTTCIHIQVYITKIYIVYALTSFLLSVFRSIQWTVITRSCTTTTITATSHRWPCAGDRRYNGCNDARIPWLLLFLHISIVLAFAVAIKLVIDFITRIIGKTFGHVVDTFIVSSQAEARHIRHGNNAGRQFSSKRRMLRVGIIRFRCGAAINIDECIFFI